MMYARSSRILSWRYEAPWLFPVVVTVMMICSRLSASPPTYVTLLSSQSRDTQVNAEYAFSTVLAAPNRGLKAELKMDAIGTHKNGAISPRTMRLWIFAKVLPSILTVLGTSSCSGTSKSTASVDTSKGDRDDGAWPISPDSTQCEVTTQDLQKRHICSGYALRELSCRADKVLQRRVH